MFLYGVHKDGSDHQNGVVLVKHCAQAKGMGVEMLFMHGY